MTGLAVANVGDDPNWTGHKLAQSNLYAYGRLAWDPGADPVVSNCRISRHHGPR